MQPASKHLINLASSIPENSNNCSGIFSPGQLTGLMCGGGSNNVMMRLVLT